ncbi:succinylglutamate desuccinylase/aspartoacylase domain-containing protein [Nonomuraea basaltis]|uniref:succinylglutamate desuccinylase/aspartoacylase domain-containing protein n=1 Tax=Nonomuraea basaltis TaxID=2495887 RepID=UPI00110C6CAA|nr:succinylglutamate desuccinylase/aspartoacylase family protein [Nonomuraea basaltis]TMR97836.1 ethanolamine utilization protein EutE [Nonomuraea basaltis]
MTWTIATLTAEPGAKTSGTVTVDLGTTIADVPLILIHGSRPGPTVVITGGVHGGEFAGISAAAQLAARLQPDDVLGRIAICPVSNPPAVYGGRLNVSPLDGVNINRVFPGDPAGGPTERMAAWLFEHLIPGTDAYADLHSGGIDQTLLNFVGYRLTGDDALDARNRAMAHAVGYEYVVFGRSADGGNSHAAANRLGIPAVLIETGQRGDRDPATVRTLLDALHRLLNHLGALDDPAPAPAATPSPEWEWTGFVDSPATGLWYPDAATGDEVTEGQTIGRIIDPVGGGEHKVTATATGTILYGMNGLTVVPGTELAAIAVLA